MLTEDPESSSIVTRMLYQSIPFHAPGIGTNLISNALLTCAAGNDTYSIATNNYPLPYDQSVSHWHGGTHLLRHNQKLPDALRLISQ